MDQSKIIDTFDMYHVLESRRTWYVGMMIPEVLAWCRAQEHGILHKHSNQGEWLPSKPGSLAVLEVMRRVATLP